jgi:hypothetical protein
MAGRKINQGGGNPLISIEDIKKANKTVILWGIQSDRKY